MVTTTHDALMERGFLDLGSEEEGFYGISFLDREDVMVIARRLGDDDYGVTRARNYRGNFLGRDDISKLDVDGLDALVSYLKVPKRVDWTGVRASTEELFYKIATLHSKEDVEPLAEKLIRDIGSYDAPLRGVLEMRFERAISAHSMGKPKFFDQGLSLE